MVTQSFLRSGFLFLSLTWLASTAFALHPVPGTFEAEDFDQGGEGVGYHENTPGNQGDAGYRIGEDVDVFVTNDAQSGSPYIVKNFESGEWLAYTLNVQTSGNYAIAVRASTNFYFPNSSYYVQVDGINVTDTVTLPNTGGWDQYQWLGERTISLTAGSHLLRIVAVTSYFNLNSIRITSTGGPSSPYFGAPATAVRGVIDAEAFDAGGEGVGYHDTTPGNQGDSGIREGEDVDIFVTNDAGSGSPYIVKNLEAGEWLAYTINVPTTGDYNVGVRASTQADFPNPAYHLEIDGVNVTGRVVLPDTGGWNHYQWNTGSNSIRLTSGTHVLKIVSERPYFMLNSIVFDAAFWRYAVPGQIEAEDFARYTGPYGGEGDTYHDNTFGNQGNAVYNSTGGPDIFFSNDSGSGSWYIIKNFEAGEWLSGQRQPGYLHAGAARIDPRRVPAKRLSRRGQWHTGDVERRPA